MASLFKVAGGEDLPQFPDEVVKALIERGEYDKAASGCLRLVVRIVFDKFQNYPMDLTDLAQVGCIGLMKAVKNFDLESGNRFSSYAVPKITGEIMKHCRREGIIKKRRRLIGHIKAIEDFITQYKEEHGARPSIKKITSELGISKDIVLEYFHIHRPVSLNKKVDFGEGGDVELWEYLEDTRNSYDDLMTEMILDENLDERERLIVGLRLDGHTQSEIGERVGVSQMQISRILSGIKKELKGFISNI